MNHQSLQHPPPFLPQLDQILYSFHHRLNSSTMCFQEYISCLNRSCFGMIPKRLLDCALKPNCTVEYVRIPNQTGEASPYCHDCTVLGREGRAREMRHARSARAAKLKKAQKTTESPAMPGGGRYITFSAVPEEASARARPGAYSNFSSVPEVSSARAGLGGFSNFSSIPEEKFETTGDLGESYSHPAPFPPRWRDLDESFVHPAPGLDRRLAVPSLPTPSGPAENLNEPFSHPAPGGDRRLALPSPQTPSGLTGNLNEPCIHPAPGRVLSETYSHPAPVSPPRRVLHEPFIHPPPGRDRRLALPSPPMPSGRTENLNESFPPPARDPTEGLSESESESSIPPAPGRVLHEPFIYPAPGRDRRLAVPSLPTPSGPTIWAEHDATPAMAAAEMESYCHAFDPVSSPSSADEAPFPEVDLARDRFPRIGDRVGDQPAVVAPAEGLVLTEEDMERFRHDVDFWPGI